MKFLGWGLGAGESVRCRIGQRRESTRQAEADTGDMASTINDAIDKLSTFVPLSELQTVFGSLLSSHSPADIKSVVEIPSAQQHVFLVTASLAASRPDVPPPTIQFVLRLWTGCARWWNLNLTLPSESVAHAASSSGAPNASSSSSPDISEYAISNPLTIANAEVDGYRVARRAFESSSTGVSVPEVLYCSFSSSSSSSTPASSLSPHPYCILSFVGSPSHSYTRSPISSMIKDRVEFGFLEPHPRHGRVPADRSLEYALLLLETVVAPLQSLAPTPSAPTPFTFRSTMQMYASASVFFARRWLLPESPPTNPYLPAATKAFSQCLSALSAGFASVSDLPPRLCHCDLQPQNLLFHRLPLNSDTTSNTSDSSDPADPSYLPTPFPQPAFVLDWEDSCFADPRFEVTLICRKVVANFPQASAVWSRYSEMLRSADASLDVGPIEPWLSLEGVHSVATLLLQWANAGGRNSWEKEKDLEKKIGREFARLRQLGGDDAWSFLSDVEEVEGRLP